MPSISWPLLKLNAFVTIRNNDLASLPGNAVICVAQLCFSPINYGKIYGCHRTTIFRILENTLCHAVVVVSAVLQVWICEISTPARRRGGNVQRGAWLVQFADFLAFSLCIKLIGLIAWTPLISSLRAVPHRPRLLVIILAADSCRDK